MKRLTLFLLIALISLKGISQASRQPGDSVTCIPNSQLRTAASWIEKGKLAAIERDAARDSIRIYVQRISIKDSIILNYKSTNLQYSGLIDSYKQEIKILEKQKNLALDMYAAERKAGKRRKFLATVKTIGVTALASTATYFLIK